MHHESSAVNKYHYRETVWLQSVSRSAKKFCLKNTIASGADQKGEKTFSLRQSSSLLYHQLHGFSHQKSD
jgi:hypothetical protein